MFTSSFTKTYTFGGDQHGQSGGSGGHFNMSQGMGGMNIGGQNIMSFGGDDGGRSGGRSHHTHGGGGGGSQKPSAFYSKPQVNIGRPSKKAAKSPFAGLEQQKYDDIKSKCLQDGMLFEDPEFPAEDNSIFFSRRPPRPFVWKRPHEICDDPKFFVEGASRFDVKQGELGDCWLLAAIASLTCDQKLLYRVVPPDQSFSDKYAGIFRFQFWHQGHWVDVVVDDRLPTYYDQLVFMHSVDKNEFWSALLEKAYAKLEGSYESLKGGSTSEAMEDFTGGVTEMFELDKPPANLFTIMKKAFERSSLMGCSIDQGGRGMEAELDNGLVVGHAYSITSVQMVDIKTSKMTGQIPLIRIRNPWGNEAEWKGAWGDKSREWSLLSQAEREEHDITFSDDGEFWMSFQDFIKEFTKLEICNLGPDSLDEDEVNARSKKKWEVNVQDGTWEPRQSAGGCRNYINTFWTNPQFRVKLTDPDDDDDDDECTMIVGLLQKDRRKKRKEGLDMLTMGYAVYKLPEDKDGPLDEDFFKYNASTTKSPSFINLREVTGRHKLPPGLYAIIPSTFEPGQKGDFLLRIFSEKANESGEIDEETGYVEQAQKGQSDSSHSGSHGAAPTPSSEDRETEDFLKRSFKQISGDDMEVDAYELQDILNTVFQKEFTFSGFGVDTCRSMVAMNDGDTSGKLGYEEFEALWKDLRKWKTVFKKYDTDRSGNLNSHELRNAFHNVGFKISNRTFRCLVMRYAQRNGQIEFGDFVSCAVRLKTMIASFKGLEQSPGQAVFSMDDFIQTTMYS